MLKFNDRPRGDNELVLYWTSPPFLRCVLVGTGDGVDLQLQRDGVVLRRTLNVDPRYAREMAMQWRVECELERVRAELAGADVCPECGEDEPSFYHATGVGARKYCRACGHDWAAAGERRE